jgi:predicted ATPase/DNA-binding SARP family transcriptional activator
MVEFDVLGPLCVRSEEGALALGTPAQRSLLAVLLTSPNAPLSDDRLMNELWGDELPASARHLLHVYVSRLRRALGESPDGPRITRQGGGYALRLARSELDSSRFEAALAQGLELREREPDAAERVLASAMRIWQGAPFADLPEPPPAVREHAAFLEREHLEALEAWGEVRLRLGHHRDLIPELAALVAQHPYNETLHGELMLALYRDGRQAEALETARALRRRLRDELGIEPGPAVRDLYRDMLLQARHLALEPPEPPDNLPSPLTSFVGRAGELREIAALLAESRLVTLTGPGGIGKTRLAIEAGRQLRARFPGGIWWIDLAPVSDPTTVADEVAAALGVSPGPEGYVAALTRSLHRRDALLLLDNCERVAAAAGKLAAAVLREAGGPRVLATSRTPLFAEGERLWAVPPLSLPAEGSRPADLAGSDAARLFVERARSVDASFALDVDNAAAVAEVCRRLDGVSLAIEMAAARLGVLSPREIVARLDDRFALLEQSAVGALTRYRTLQAAFDASYDLLAEREQSAFDRLAVFAGPFELDAAAAVSAVGGDLPGRVLPVVTALVDSSLLTTVRDDAETRYRLLESLREYGAAHLRERGGEHQARRAHAAHYLDLAAQAGAVLGTPDFAQWMPRLASGYLELRQALDWSLEHEEPAMTLRAVPALREFWYRRGDALEARRWTARMLEGELAAVPAALYAEVHDAAAFAAYAMGDWAVSSKHAEEAVRLAREGDATPALVFALFGRSNIALGGGDIESARRFAQEALEESTRHGTRWSAAGPLTMLGFASLFGGGSLADARSSFEQALPLYRELGDLGALVVMTLTPLTAAALRQHDLDAAEEYATESVQLASGTGWEASALVCYGQVLIEEGDLDGAEAAELRGLRVALEAGLEHWFRPALRDLAHIAAKRRQFVLATTLAAASRRNMPAYFLDPSIYEPLEELCRGALGDARFDQLVEQADTMTHNELVGLVGAHG